MRVRARPGRRSFVPAPALALAFAAAACAPGVPRGPGASLVSPDPARHGENGGDGPLGAARVSLTSQLRVRQSLVTEITFPALADGTLDRAHAPYPVVVFVQGGAVPVRRYGWVARHLATHGYVVAAPGHFADLALFETDNARFALTALRDASAVEGSTVQGAVSPNAPAAVMGHSLGGVVSERVWLTAEFQALVLLASYPADGDPVATRAGSPVLSLVGANDRKAARFEMYREGFENFSPPRWFGVVEEMNHYAWTDDTSQRELASDGPSPAAGVEASRLPALRMVDAFLDAHLRGDPTARARLELPFANVEVRR